MDPLYIIIIQDETTTLEEVQKTTRTFMARNAFTSLQRKPTDHQKVQLLEKTLEEKDQEIERINNLNIELQQKLDRVNAE